MSNQNPKVSNVENKPVVIRLVAVFVIIGLMVGAYFLGRADAVPAELADINRKIDNLSSAITDQQRSFESIIGEVARELGEFADDLESLGVGQGKIVSGIGQVASRLSEINANILGAIDRLGEVKGIVGSNDEPLRELLINLQRLQAIIGKENARPTE